MRGKWASSRVKCCHNWGGTTGALACVWLYVCEPLYLHANKHTHTHMHLLPPCDKIPPNTTRAGSDGSLLPNELSD